MTKEWIECFYAVAKKQNFTAAAESLYIAESTASKRIVQLEKYLGVKLFERNKRSVRLTAAGQVFLSDVRRICSMVMICCTVSKRPLAGLYRCG
ncbi:LysR family transcriptional regulator [uncultured Mitsuokella sp.]|uniref:LysR family transcriptional regulator n=1 Tax=uncultured Mitsuokella sp. TaxID=453120 RepID=UPI0034A0484F